MILIGMFFGLLILWNEPRWAVWAACSAIAALLMGGMMWMSRGLYLENAAPNGQLDYVAERWLAAAVTNGILFVGFVGMGLALVVFRGAYVRAKKRRDDAETEVELARLRKGQ